jgi:sulfotransferase family protein
MAGRLPGFYIVGHAKCGTTALTAMLRKHPQIAMPVKEPRFFSLELRTRYWRPASNRRKHPTTLDGYMALFEGLAPDLTLGEASTTYLRSSTAAGRIAEVKPDARIIAILREPTAFLRSFHLQSLRNYDENQKSFRKAIELERSRREGRRMPRFSQVPSSLFYSDHIHYVEQLERFHAVLPREQVLVLIYDDLRADNEATVRRVLGFLGVDDSGFTVPHAELETLKMPRSVALDQITRLAAYAPRSRALRPLLKAGARTGVGRLGPVWRRALYEDRPPADEDFNQELRRRFKGEVQAASEYLGRDLVSLWGYDKLD